MPDPQMPLNPKDSRFGWPKAARKEEFAARLDQKPQAHHRVVVENQQLDLPIIKVHQNLPKYRMENGRTASAQVEWLAKHADKPKDFFKQDPELWDTQEAQHELLLKLVERSILRKYFENPVNKQVDPILLDEEGFVVNGNRRLATWRDLFHSDRAKYARYEYIDVAVLPHVDPKAIDRLEASLQIEPDIKDDYTWDAEANMMLAKLDEYGEAGLAELYGKKEPQIREILLMREYAEEWLKSRGKENIWSLVAGGELAFRRIVTTRSKVGSAGRQQLFKEAAFALIDNPDEVKDSLHDAINGMALNIDAVVDKLKAGFEIAAPTTDAAADELFGGGPTPASGAEAQDLALSKAIATGDNAAKARQIIVDFIETQKLLRREAKTAERLLDCCAKANSLLEEGVKLGLMAETKTEGVEAQLAQLEAKIARIRAFVAGR
jgi:hypothetical protein